MDENRKQRLQYLSELVDGHCYRNREEICESDRCLCTGCGAWLMPAEIIKWYEELHACCPHCGLTGVVVGSKSGIPLDEVHSNMKLE